MNRTIKALLYPYVVWIAMMIVVPFFLIFFYSITQSRPDSPAIFRFTLQHYREFFKTENINILSKSVILAVETTILCLVLGYPAAWIISKTNVNIQNMILLLFILPMWINMLLRTYAWQVILSRTGLLYTDTAVVIGMVYNFIPFMVLPIYTAITKIDKSLIEAANDLGASSKEAFLKVVFPLSMPGVITGIVMVFLPAVSAFAIPRLLGGGQYVLIGNLIEKQFYLLNNWNFGSAVSVILMILILISMRFMRKSGEISGRGGAILW
ncbi:MAG: ABC transporter permease [Bacilli bacterium]|nr:ABC transporter permease [Bacilli bacterium]